MVTQAYGNKHQSDERNEHQIYSDWNMSRPLTCTNRAKTGMDGISQGWKAKTCKAGRQEGVVNRDTTGSKQRQQIAGSKHDREPNNLNPEHQRDD